MSKPIDFRGVLPVPPLARKADARRSLDFAENDRLVRHMAAGGITQSLIQAKAAAEGIVYQPGWMLTVQGTVKVFIVVFIVMSLPSTETSSPSVF